MIEEVSFALLSLVIIAVAGIAYYTRPSYFHRLWRKSNERLVLGLPIASAIIVCVNLTFFAFAQRAAIGDELLTVPFFSWSYTYPMGYLTSPIGHGNVPHITGNLIAAAVFAPVAEYIIGHKNGRHPILRAFVGIPLAWYGVGVFISLFTWGPSIGFSGVVFFFYAFVAVFFPLLAVGLLIVRVVVSTVVGSLTDPVVVQTVSESLSRPSWAGISVDGHALGALAGIFLAVLVARRRDTDLDAFKIGGAFLVFGIVQGLYAIWSVDSSTYYLFRGIGIAVVGFFAVIIAYGISVEASSPPLLANDQVSFKRLSAVAALIVPLLFLCGVGFVTGFGGVTTTEDIDAVEVGDYEIWYGENVENERVISIPLIDIAPINFTASGVFVTSERRGIWQTVASQRQLRSSGGQEFAVGGLTWDETVEIERIGTTTVTGNTSYSVLITTENQTREVFDSEPGGTGVSVDGWNFELSTDGGEHNVIMRRDGVVRRAYLGVGEGVETVVEGFEFFVEDDRVKVSSDGTTAVLGWTDQDTRRSG